MHFCARVLEATGHPIRPGLPIVDLGCGGGQVVRDLRALGLDAYGCDFQFTKDKTGQAVEMERSGVLRRIQPRPYRLPFDDVSVSYVISETVLEHVSNLDETIAEMARITKPGGATFHFFPARLSMIEPHVNVPFGGVLRSRPYLLACAALGFRKPGDRRPIREVAAANREYLGRGVHYLPTSALRAAFARRFRRVEFVEDAYFAVSDRPKVKAFAKLPLSWLAYRTFRATVLLAADPRQ